MEGAADSGHPLSVGVDQPRSGFALHVDIPERDPSTSGDGLGTVKMHLTSEVVAVSMPTSCSPP
jgi:hypothetical protein